MLPIYHYFKSFLQDQRGVSAIEYSVLAAIIVGLLVSAFGGDEGLSSIIEQTFETIKTKITELTAAE
jgi:Flp pilus assembly pilin Flp